MKNIVFCFLLSLLLMGCSTFNSFNGTLNGTWDLSTLDGIQLPVGVSVTYVFTKTDNTNGNYTRTSISNGTSIVVSGIYAVSTDVKLSLKPDGSNTIEYESIASHTATTLQLLDQIGHMQYLIKQ